MRHIARVAMFVALSAIVACSETTDLSGPNIHIAANALPATSCPNLPAPWKDWRVSPPSEKGPQYATNAYRWNCSNAKVDAAGRLHLLLTRSRSSSQWQGVQVVSNATYAPGHTFTANVVSKLSDVTTAAPSSVFGFFLYTGPDGANEIDIEASNWSGSYSAPMQYTVYPSSTKYKPALPQHKGTNAALKAPTVHKIQWNASSVAFSSTIQGANAPFASWTYTPCTLCSTPYVPQTRMPVILNLWVDGGGKRMGSANTYEVVIASVNIK